MNSNNLKKNKDYQNELSPEEIKEINHIELNKYSKSAIVKDIYLFFITIFNFILKSTLMVLKFSGIYLLWICLHYFSAHLYVKFCVPDTIIGFVMSPFMIATPHCQGLRWIVYNAAEIINNMWIIFGMWIYSIIWVFNRPSQINSTNI